MKLIVGLGNPGASYEATRHNVGFWIIDHISKALHLSFQNKFQSQYIKANHSGHTAILLKPQTYMNLSGQAVQECAHFFKIPTQDILVLSDDLDLPPNKARFRVKGSDGGHNGLKSITQCMGTQDYPRLRIGIGRPTNRQPVNDYVLGKWAPDQLKMHEELEPQIVQMVFDFIEGKELQNTTIH